ncbi:uncharacterized protein At4g02000-like [Arachis hypogaea]|uniref:uncharacterized protein At4g02000-like n=1 Tax=Arachis hypogaea TaxID=3818 RepID=UPI000DEC575E|nr:uncharacterized protein LOC112722089 [Arachis hypogaea]
MAELGGSSRKGRSQGLEKEEVVVGFEDKDIVEGLQKCSRSLVGRMLADQAFSVGTMESALFSIWGQPAGFKVQSHGGNLFQFFFPNEMDVLRIVKRTPWLFKNYILNLRRWRQGVAIEKKEFVYVSIWIQLWGLPEHCKTKELGRKVGGALEKVLDVDLFLIKGKEEHRIVKVHINLDVTRPLRRILKIAGLDERVIELKLRYERIGNFCNYCGQVDHEVC